MINRENYRLTKKYLEYRRSVDQVSDRSLGVERTYIVRILNWADETPFEKIRDRRPTLPEFLLTKRLGDQEGQLSAVSIRKTLSTARKLFTWLRENEVGYQKIKPAWIKTLKPKRTTEVYKNREAVSLPEILEIAKVPVETTAERRIRAAACFLYLSGQRISAFVTTPIMAVDIQNRMVKQHPSLGVRTKYNKYATTYLLPIPELLGVVTRWDQEVRAVLPGRGFWFAPLTIDTGEIDSGCFEVGSNRHNLARKNLKAWMEKNGLPYKSPHKFRHGHIHFGMENAKELDQFKAVSMNVMHSSMRITEEIYSRLHDDTVKRNIDALGDRGRVGEEEETAFELFQEFLKWRKKQGK